MSINWWNCYALLWPRLPRAICWKDLRPDFRLYELVLSRGVDWNLSSDSLCWGCPRLEYNLNIKQFTNSLPMYSQFLREFCKFVSDRECVVSIWGCRHWWFPMEFEGYGNDYGTIEVFPISLNFFCLIWRMVSLIPRWIYLLPLWKWSSIKRI